ncbi:MAG: hemagglutinin repeat-containing protein, partial [Betaproteobacteria bacterium]
RLDMGAAHITNRDGALLYSAGDLAIGRYLDSNHHATGQARRLDNLSAHIDAEGDMDVAVDDIRNMNLHYSTRKQSRSPESMVEVAGEGSPNRYATDAPDVYAYIDESYHLHTPEGNYERWLRYRYQRTVTDEVTASSAPAEIIAGDKLRVRGETLTNDKSRILAGGELDVQVATLNNIDATGTRTTVDVGAVDSFWRDHRKGRDRTGSSEAAYEPPPLVQSMSLGVVGYEGQTQSTAAHGGDISQGQGLVTRNLSLSVPNTSLYRAAPLARGYMVETDPRFTSYKAWLGSDYLLQQLALDPQQMQKRLGDGFCEQRLVREQVAQLTGRRFLPGYANDEAQFQALMDHASTFAKAYTLRPGIALSAEQMALLTSDIVWLVERDVTLPNGQATRALVPQVYMRVREGDLRADGALLSGAQVRLSVTGDLNNSATIAGDSVALHANNINNVSGSVKGNSVAVAAVRDINSVGGSIKAESALTLSAGNDITIASTTRSSSNGQGSRTDIDRVAGLYVIRDDGQLVVAAGHNLTIKGAVLQQGAPAVSVTNRSDTTSSATAESGRIMLAAGDDVVLDTVTEARSERIDWGGGNHRSESRRTDVASTVNAAGAVNIIAGRDIVSRGAQISTRPSAPAQPAERAESSTYTSTHTSTETTASTNTSASTPTTTPTSTRSNSQSGDIHLSAARDVVLSTAESQVSVDESHRHTRRGFLSRTTTSTRESLDQTTQSGTLLSGERVSVQSGQDITVSGSAIASSTGTALDAGRNVTIAAASDTRRETHLAQTKTSGLMSSDGVGITIGNRSVKSTSDTTATTAVASTVGSTRGDVQMSAGDAFTQTG